MLRHGLLICSFLFKEKNSKVNSKNIYLNEQFEYKGELYESILSLFNTFFNHHHDFLNDESMMKLFSINSNSIKVKKNDDASIVSVVIQSGSYGVESDITNVSTKKLVYKRNDDDADIKPFQLMIFIPRDAGDKKVIKGIFIFESIGSFGVKTITTKFMNTFFSNNYNLILETRNIAPKIFIENLIKRSSIKKISFIRNNVSKDKSNNIFFNTGREEISYIKPKIKGSAIDTIFDYINGINTDILEFNNEIYDNVQFTFSMNGRNKTFKLDNFDKLSITEDVPQYIYDNSRIDREKLFLYMEKTAYNYMSNMIMVENN